MIEGWKFTNNTFSKDVAVDYDNKNTIRFQMHDFEWNQTELCPANTNLSHDKFLGRKLNTKYLCKFFKEDFTIQGW